MSDREATGLVPPSPHSQGSKQLKAKGKTTSNAGLISSQPHENSDMNVIESSKNLQYIEKGSS